MLVPKRKAAAITDQIEPSAAYIPFYAEDMQTGHDKNKYRSREPHRDARYRRCVLSPSSDKKNDGPRRQSLRTEVDRANTDLVLFVGKRINIESTNSTDAPEIDP